MLQLAPVSLLFIVFPIRDSHFCHVADAQPCLGFCTVQIVVTVRSDAAKSERQVLFQDGQNNYWNFPADETACSLVHQQAFKHRTLSKQFGNWFQLNVEWLQMMEEELESNRNNSQNLNGGSRKMGDLR
jgi:hypothetical protein